MIKIINFWFSRPGILSYFGRQPITVEYMILYILYAANHRRENIKYSSVIGHVQPTRPKRSWLFKLVKHDVSQILTFYSGTYVTDSEFDKFFSIFFKFSNFFSICSKISEILSNFFTKSSQSKKNHNSPREIKKTV